MSERRNSYSTRFEVRQQGPRLIAAMGCAIGSLLIVAMALYAAYQLFVTISINNPFAFEPNASVFTAPRSTRTPFPTFEPPATPTLAVPEGISENGGVDGGDSAESAATPRPTADVSEVNPGNGQGLIAYVSNETGNFEVYTVNIDGSNKQRLTDNWFGDWRPIWSSDGSKIVFHSKRDGNWEVYMMNADGADKVNLTNNLADDSFPTWSPDGGRVAFHSNRSGNFDIYVMNADGTNPTQLTTNGANDYGPMWSPDGASILFTRELGGAQEIFEMAADGSTEKQLTDAEGGSFAPMWSPDGGKIVFHSNRDGNYEIYKMNADGTNVIRVTNTEADDFFPSWSPDGQWITFHSNVGAGENGDRNIVLISADGLREKSLTTDTGQERMPHWRP